MSEWQVSKPLGQCTGTGRQIEPGSEYFAALVESEQGFKRLDFSVAYWQQHKPQVYCYWKTRLPDSGRKKRLFVDDAMLTAFFERLAEETEQSKLNFRFVLAMILMRRRRLRYDSCRNENGCEIWRLRVVGENEFAEVKNPKLDDEQVEQLSIQLTEILQTDF
jgi:hypothetical protein